ncbi:hypothetical protein DCC81_24170 [Chitinophaga parva]|uniref:Uncharacterized protein n=1 Tax=Chitinophaga parva TaxID=2169414 RepID=A0A2T7BBD2_9BACT|nr:hypothetical protein [Chitinophaga parva]PUZ21690.1 hypothetical protein DCC81_24170 [Chitinophaga parva]
MRNTLINQILVFKTNILTANAELHVAHLLNAQSNILQWNIDHDDIDEVLRVVVLGMEAEHIIILIESLGLCCEVLPNEVPINRF